MKGTSQAVLARLREPAENWARGLEPAVVFRLRNVAVRIWLPPGLIEGEVRDWYGPFAVDQAGPETLEVRCRGRDSWPDELVAAARDEGEMYRNVTVMTDELLTEDEIAVFRWDFRTLLRRSTGEGRALLLAHTPNTADAVARITVSLALPRLKSVLFHGAGLAIDGRGYLFLGRSGSGKSTLAELSGQTVLNDEICQLSIEAGRLMLSGTPFFGSLRRCTNQSVPLAGIFALAQSETTRVEALDPYAQSRALMQTAMTFARAAPDLRHVLETLEAIRTLSPVRRLHFQKNSAFLNVLEAR